MPDREESDSPRVPASLDRQLPSIAKLAIVVGVPFVSAFLNVPLWFTVLLLIGLAVFFFVVPHIPRKTQTDPKQAWTRLMASFVKLQSNYCELKESPSNAAALKQFLMFEERCLSILSSRADSGWGPDSQYAPKIRNEVAAMSAEVHAKVGTPAPTPGPGIEPPAGGGEQVSTSASQGAAVQPGAPAPSDKPEVPTSEGLLDLIFANEGAAARSGSPMSSSRPDVPTPTEEPGLMPASMDSAVQHDTSPSPSARVESPTPVKEQVLVLVGGGTAPDSDNSAPLARYEAATREEMQVLTLANDGTAPQFGSPAASPMPEVTDPAERLGMMLASTIAAVQVEPSPLLSARPEVTTPAEKHDLAPATEGADLAGRRLTPYVWLPGGVEDAAAFYLSIFKNSRITGTSRYPEGRHAQAWSVMTATVCLDGQELILLNGGSVYKLPEAFSLLVRCADQAEVDYYWEKLLAGGGEANACGWLKDRFGVSWQVIPDALLELINDPDPQRAARATEAMLKMKKIDVATLREAVGQTEATAILPLATMPALTA